MHNNGFSITRGEEEHDERTYSGGSLASSTTRLVPGVPAGTRRDEFSLRDILYGALIV